MNFARKLEDFMKERIQLIAGAISWLDGLESLDSLGRVERAFQERAIQSPWKRRKREERGRIDQNWSMDLGRGKDDKREEDREYKKKMGGG